MRVSISTSACFQMLDFGVAWDSLIDDFFARSLGKLPHGINKFISGAKFISGNASAGIEILKSRSTIHSLLAEALFLVVSEHQEKSLC